MLIIATIIVKFGHKVFKQIQGIPMGSYHSRQMADLILLLAELTYPTTNHVVECRNEKKRSI